MWSLFSSLRVMSQYRPTSVSVSASGVCRPSPVSELAHGLSSACITNTSIDSTICSPSSAVLFPSSVSSSCVLSSGGAVDESDTPTTALVLGPGSSRWRRCAVLGDASTDPARRGSLPGDEDSRRRCRTLPLRRRLLAAATNSDFDKENAGPTRPHTPVKQAMDVGGIMSPGDWRVREPLAALQSPLRQPGSRLSVPQHRPSLSGKCGNGSKGEEFCFVAPTNRAPRSSRSANFCSTSASSFSSTGSSSSSSLGSGGWNSPQRSVSTTSADDGFINTIDLDTMNETSMPAALRDLLSAPIIHSPVSVTTTLQSSTSSSSSSRPALSSSGSRCRQQKRCQPPCPLPLLKRPCLVRSESFSPTVHHPPLQRCHSESEASIKRALQRSCQDPDLISDFTRSYALPLCREASSKNIDLRPVSVDTLAALLLGQFDDTVSSFQIIDCRYPYEFDGGHIRGAVNWYIKDQVHRHLLGTVGQLEPPSLDHVPTHKRHVLIFHCEFSSERGPGMFRFVRAQDRHINHQCYPALHYPEMYLLDGGYKKFFARFPHLCDPCSYKPMNKEGHERDLKHFRAKSKSWAGNGRTRSVSKRIIL